ncbi:MAG: DNA polymerase III subunit gamma/tau [Muribaculaceae bacterium]|nr:DNA polymerase III subunit gamma/tau [Muribaculaceae bacterium]
MEKNYIPLYRKYRPQAIEQIVGQEHIKKALANAIEMDRISHAYLFTGPRGTGKTSTARIFAKSLNCEKGMTLSPCNECENCKNITNSIPIDVIEIDAASNRSVNDADEIIQKVALAPVRSRYKIYIIDEVHMLTNQAFNALLKTLEEPPKNVIFILATTEVHKVLDTIKSRCQRFDFKRITTDDIAKHLRYISDSERINITDDALNLIAQNSAGGMRDSIALLDQLSVLNSTQEAISVDDINNLLGRLSFASLSSLFSAIVSSNQNDALGVLNDIYNQGNEPIQILSNLLEYLRNSLIVKTVGSNVSNTVIQLNEDQIKQLCKALEPVETHQLVSLIDKCANYIKELKITTNPKLWLDVAILDMSNLVENTKLEDLQKRLAALESGEGVKMVNVSAYNTPPAPVKKPEVMRPIKPQPVQAAQPSSEQEKTSLSEDAVLNDPVPMSKPAAVNGLKASWGKLLENISSFPSRAILKQQAMPVKITQEEVIISIKNPSWLKQFGQDGAKHSFIVDAVKSMYGSANKVIVRAPEANDDNIRKESSAADDDTPAPASKPAPVEKKEPEPTVEEIDDAVQEVKSEDSQTHITKAKTGDALFHSDTVNNVIDLFEGKFIE